MGVESRRTLFRDPQCQRNAQQVIRENRVKSFAFKLRQSCLQMDETSGSDQSHPTTVTHRQPAWRLSFMAEREQENGRLPLASGGSSRRSRSEACLPEPVYSGTHAVRIQIREGQDKDG